MCNFYMYPVCKVTAVRTKHEQEQNQAFVFDVLVAMSSIVGMVVVIMSFERQLHHMNKNILRLFHINPFVAIPKFTCAWLFSSCSLRGCLFGHNRGTRSHSSLFYLLSCLRETV